jgi:hypothetical protein
MSKRRKSYTSPSIINPTGMHVALRREIHPEVAPRYDSVIKFIAGLQLTGIDVLPRQDTAAVTLLHSETVRQFFSQRQNSQTTLDTDDLLDLEYELNKLLGDEAPFIALEDEQNPLRVDEHDRLVIDFKETIDLQIDRCRVLSGLTKIIQSRNLNAKDIDGLLNPVAPSIPIATIDRRVLGDRFEDIVHDPSRYLDDESMVRLDRTVFPINTYIPLALPLGNISVGVTPKNTVRTTTLVEHFPDISFDGVKKVKTHEMEYS